MFLKYFSRYETDVLYCVHLSSTILPKIKEVWGEKHLKKKQNKIKEKKKKSINQNSTKISGEMDFIFFFQN